MEIDRRRGELRWRWMEVEVDSVAVKVDKGEGG